MTATATKEVHSTPAEPTHASLNLVPSSKLKVLFVEDDRLALDELGDIAEIEGWEHIVAHNVNEALKILEEDQDIRVVVTDVHFVERFGVSANGIQFVSRARAKFHDRQLNYIVLSGDPHAVVSSEQEGAFEFLSKPLVPDHLVSAVMGAIADDRKEVEKRFDVIDGNTESRE